MCLTWKSSFQGNCFLPEKRFCCILGWVSIVILNTKSRCGFCYYSLRRWFTLCLGGGERRKEVSKGVSLGHIYYLTGIWESLCCNTLLLSRSLHFSQVRKKSLFLAYASLSSKPQKIPWRRRSNPHPPHVTNQTSFIFMQETW